MPRISFLLLLFSCLTFSYCEDEYIEGVGWKKIYYPSDGPPREAVGRCKTDEDQILTVVALAAIGWAIYENVEFELSLYANDNLVILPLDSVKINEFKNPELTLTLFEFKY